MLTTLSSKNAHLARYTYRNLYFVFAKDDDQQSNSYICDFNEDNIDMSFFYIWKQNRDEPNPAKNPTNEMFPSDILDLKDDDCH